MDKYSHLDITNLNEFIIFGEDLINDHENVFNKGESNSTQVTIYNNNFDPNLLFYNKFKQYSRNYMNFLMNHTNLIYIIVIYRNLLLKIEDHIDYIKHIIYINNYILSIISNTTYKRKIHIITNFIEYENYFKVAIAFQTNSSYVIQLKERLSPLNIVTNINILDCRYSNINKFVNYELYDYIKFFFFIGYEIYYLTHFEIIKELLDDLSKKNINTLIEIIHPITKSFYNILYMKYKSDLNIVLNIMNFQQTKINSPNQIINKYMDFVIKNDNKIDFIDNKKILILGSIIGFLIYNIKI